MRLRCAACASVRDDARAECQRGLDGIFGRRVVGRLARSRRGKAVVDEHALLRPEIDAPVHLRGGRPARLAEQRQRISGRRAVEHDPSARTEQIHHPREEVAPDGRDHDVDRPAIVCRAHPLGEGAAGVAPSRARRRLDRHGREDAGARGIGPVDGRRAPLGDQPRLHRARHEPGDRGAAHPRARHRIEPGPTRGALDEDALTVLHTRDVVQRLVHRLEIQHVGRRLGQGEPLGVCEPLRRLAAHELRERAVRCLVALDAELGMHRILSSSRREEVRHAGIQHTELADLQPALARDFAANRGDEDDGTAARHMHVAIVQVEDRDRHAARREHGVVRETRI